MNTPMRRFLVTVVLTAVAAAAMAGVATAQFKVEALDARDQDGKVDTLEVDSKFYRFRFALWETGSALSMIYKPLNHELRAENYYRNHNNMFRDWVRLTEPNRVTGYTRKIGGAEISTATRLPATYRVVRQTDEELVLEFETRYPATEGVAWLEKIVNRRRLFIRNDTPAIRVENEIVNTDDAEHPVLFDAFNSVGLGRTDTHCFMPAMEGKIVGFDSGAERGSRFTFAPEIAGAWTGGVNAEGLGAAFSFDWADVDCMELDMWKTVGATYSVNMRRRKVPRAGR